MRGGFDHGWVGINNDGHVGRVVPDPTQKVTDGISNHVLTLDREHVSI